jgi:hypothetical protein
MRMGSAFSRGCGAAAGHGPVIGLTARGACLACEAGVSRGRRMQRPHSVRAQLAKSVPAHTQERS